MFGAPPFRLPRQSPNSKQDHSTVNTIPQHETTWQHLRVYYPCLSNVALGVGFFLSAGSFNFDCRTAFSFCGFGASLTSALFGAIANCVRPAAQTNKEQQRSDGKSSLDHHGGDRGGEPERSLVFWNGMQSENIYTFWSYV